MIYPSKPAIVVIGPISSNKNDWPGPYLSKQLVHLAAHAICVFAHFVVVFVT